MKNSCDEPVRVLGVDPILKAKSMEHALREYTRTKLATHFASGATVRNAEKAIYNWSVKNTRELRDVASWENHLFRRRYKQKALGLLKELGRAPVVEVSLEVVGERVNLGMKFVPQLVHRIQTKELDAKSLALYPPDILWLDGPYAQQKEKLRLKELAYDRARDADQQEVKGAFKCGRCKSDNTTYYQLQTRAADEPMVRTLMLLFRLLIDVLTWTLADHLRHLQEVQQPLEVLSVINF